MSSEEKTLPASQQKLKKAREKGQVAQSKDLITAVTLAVALLYLNSRFFEVVTRLTAVMSQPPDFKGPALDALVHESAGQLQSIIAGFVIPLFAAMAVGAFAADMIMKGGFVFSTEPLTPKFDRVDPVKGFTKLFSIRKLIDLGKALVKFIILGVGGVLVISGFLNALMWAPRCGVGCVGDIWVEMVKILSGLAVLVFAVNGLIDMRLQSWLFLRDQRQTKEERKQENKEQNQSPEVKHALKKFSKSDKRGGVEKAVIVIGDTSVAIGIRFVQGETAAPICVCKGRGQAARRIIKGADAKGIPVHGDSAFADALVKESKVMAFLPIPSYRVLSQIFKQYNIT